jgi:hypothetical protein
MIDGKTLFTQDWRYAPHSAHRRNITAARSKQW